MLRSANTKVHGRFSEKRRGLSHRCARNASAALENFVRHPKRLFQQYLPEAEVGPARLTPQHERELRAAFAIYLGNPDQDDRPVAPAPQLYRVQSW